MKRWFVLAGAVALFAAISGVVADDKPAAGKPGAKGKGKGGGQMIDAMFKRLDANGDGKLSLDEFKKMAEARLEGKLKDHPEMVKKMFEKMDANSDGFVTLEEFKKAREQMGERLKNGKGEKGKKKKDAE